MNVIVYRSKSASFAAKRVAAAAPSGLRAVQEGDYRHKEGDTAIIRWDCYTALPDRVDDWNPALAVQDARDKIVSRTLLGDLSPDTWTDRHAIRLPCVIRPRRHKAGAHFYVCRTADEAKRARLRLKRRGWYASELLDKAREFRVFVVNGRVAAVSERFPGHHPLDKHGNIAWNIALGGRLVNVNKTDWPISILKAGVEACNRIGLGWGAVDVCIDKRDRVYVFEVNTSPALKNKFTIKQIARAMAWQKAVPDVKEGAKKAISYQHPALKKER